MCKFIFIKKLVRIKFLIFFKIKIGDAPPNKSGLKTGQALT